MHASHTKYNNYWNKPRPVRFGFLLLTPYMNVVFVTHNGVIFYQIIAVMIIISYTVIILLMNIIYLYIFRGACTENVVIGNENCFVCAAHRIIITKDIELHQKFFRFANESHYFHLPSSWNTCKVATKHQQRLYSKFTPITFFIQFPRNIQCLLYNHKKQYFKSETEIIEPLMPFFHLFASYNHDKADESTNTGVSKYNIE